MGAVQGVGCSGGCVAFGCSVAEEGVSSPCSHTPPPTHRDDQKPSGISHLPLPRSSGRATSLSRQPKPLLGRRAPSQTLP